MYWLYPIFIYSIGNFFQNSRWVTYISLVEDVQPQTETTWSVQKHNKQPTKIVTNLCCCFRDMFNHNINPTNFVHFSMTILHELWVKCMCIDILLVLLFLDPKAETRLYVTVNGFEFHVYNRTDLYTRLQEIFGLEPTLIPPHQDEEKGREQRDKSLER